MHSRRNQSADILKLVFHFLGFLWLNDITNEQLTSSWLLRSHAVGGKIAEND